MEWDTTAPLTPYGQLPFFIEFLKVAGLFDALVADSAEGGHGHRWTQ